MFIPSYHFLFRLFFVCVFALSLCFFFLLPSFIYLSFFHSFVCLLACFIFFYSFFSGVVFFLFILCLLYLFLFIFLSFVFLSCFLSLVDSFFFSSSLPLIFLSLVFFLYVMGTRTHRCVFLRVIHHGVHTEHCCLHHIYLQLECDQHWAEQAWRMRKQWT